MVAGAWLLAHGRWHMEENGRWSMVPSAWSLVHGVPCAWSLAHGGEWSLVHGR